MSISRITAIRSISAFLSGILYSILSIYFFEDYTLFKTGACISAWGMGAYLGLFIFNQGRQKDPSWSYSLVMGMLFYTLTFIPLFGYERWPQGLNLLSYSILLTYIAAKIGCVQNGCCRALKSTPYLNPALFRTFEWLAYMEIGCTAVLLIIMLLTSGHFGAFEVFVVGHFLIRFVSKYFRSASKNLLHIALANKPILYALCMLMVCLALLRH